MNGTEGAICSLDGLPCPCKENYVGNRCDMCASGYYNFPECTRKFLFLCDFSSSRKLVFMLFLTFTAFFSSLVFWFAWLHWILCLTFSACQCETSNGGASDNNCDVETGQCPCQPNFAGKECNQCAHGYFKYPACTCEQYIFSKLLVYSST